MKIKHIWNHHPEEFQSHDFSGVNSLSFSGVYDFVESRLAELGFGMGFMELSISHDSGVIHPRWITKWYTFNTHLARYPPCLIHNTLTSNMHGVTCHYEYRNQQMHLKYLHAFRCNSNLIHTNQAPESILDSLIFVSSMLLFKSLPDKNYPPETKNDVKPPST